jgi:hypothetical protein
MVDLEKHQREYLRWFALMTMNIGRPEGVAEHLILTAAQAVPLPATSLALRRELDYLEERGLIKISNKQNGMWLCTLTRDGIDVVEYTVDCDPGIARPKKYW